MTSAMNPNDVICLLQQRVAELESKLHQETLRADGEFQRAEAYKEESGRWSAKALKLMQDKNSMAEQINAQSLRLDTLREALDCLLPGLVLDLRYADDDDDKEAMRSRVKTVTDALASVVERGRFETCGVLFPPGQFAVQSCSLPKGHAGEHENNIKGL